MILPPHWCPKTAAAINIEISSFAAIERCCILSSHWSWNQCGLQKAPHPHDPKASDKIDRSQSSFPRSHSSETPFHLLAKMCHQIKSALAGWFRWIKWSECEPMFCIVYNLWRKGLPRRIALDANWRRLTKLCSDTERQWMHLASSIFNLDRFSSGSLSWNSLRSVYF